MNRLPLLALLAAISFVPISGQSSDPLQTAVENAVRPSVRKGVPSSFQNIHSSLQNGVVTLTGSVPTYSDTFDAEVQVSRVAGVRAIQDDLTVAGPAASDTVLQTKLQRQIHTGTISVAVHNGIVELTGQHVDPSVASVAFNTVARTPGVQSVVNHMAINRYGSTGDPSALYTVSSVP